MSSASNPRYSGRCLCGEVTFSVSASPLVVAQCHCEECRRISGTGHTIGAMFSVETFVLSGSPGEYTYTSSQESTVTKCFCKECGSPVLGKNTRIPDHVTIPLGALDDPEGLSVEVVIFAGDKQHWDQLGDDIPIFDAQPSWTPPDSGT